MGTQRVVVVFACALAFACGQPDAGKKAEDKKAEDRRAKHAEELEQHPPHTSLETPPDPFAKYDVEAAKKAWQGTFVVEGQTAESRVIWVIEGDKLREIDGGAERELQFAVFSPCQVSTTDKAEGLTSYTNYLLVGEQLHAGSGMSGKVVGDTTIVCEGGTTYVMTGDECEAWSEEFDEWKSKPATCKVEGEGAERKFVADKQSIPFVDETSLADARMKASVVQKHPDLEAAKAALVPAPTPAPAPEAAGHHKKHH